MISPQPLLTDSVKSLTSSDAPYAPQSLNLLHLGVVKLVESTTLKLGNQELSDVKNGMRTSKVLEVEAVDVSHFGPLLKLVGNLSGGSANSRD